MKTDRLGGYAEAAESGSGAAYDASLQKVEGDSINLFPTINDVMCGE
jgi:hypothetical protein